MDDIQKYNIMIHCAYMSSQSISYYCFPKIKHRTVRLKIHKYYL